LDVLTKADLDTFAHRLEQRLDAFEQRLDCVVELQRTQGTIVGELLALVSSLSGRRTSGEKAGSDG
jgi:hypothetical protein